MINIAKDKLIIQPFVVSAIVFLISIFMGSTRFTDIAGKLIINYDIADAPILGDQLTISSLISISATIIVVNLFLIYAVYSRERFFSYILSFVNLFISAGILATLLKISSFN